MPDFHENKGIISLNLHEIKGKYKAIFIWRFSRKQEHHAILDLAQSMQNREDFTENVAQNGKINNKKRK